MRFVSDYFCFPKHIEVSALILVALAVAVADRSLLEVGSNLQEVWALALDPYRFPPLRQLFLKYVISCVLLLRTFTLHAHLACLVVMLWPAVLEDHPSLLIPWLSVGVVRYLLADSIAIATGLYICCAYGTLNTRNVEYLLVQLIEHGPAFYMWTCVYSFYYELLSYSNVGLKQSSSTDLSERRRRARFLLTNSYVNFDDKADDGRNLISESTLVGLLHPLQRQLLLGQSRSVDALLGLRAAQEEQEEILRTVFQGAPDDTAKSHVDLVMKTLSISFDDVLRARMERKSVIAVDHNLDQFIFDDNIKRITLAQAKSEGTIFKKTPFSGFPINTNIDSFTFSKTVEHKPERTDINQNDVISVADSSRTVEELEQLVSEDLLSEDNYKIQPGEKNICPKPSQVASYIPSYEETLMKETAKSHSGIGTNIKKEVVSNQNEASIQKLPARNSYSGKYKTSVEVSKKEPGTSKACEEFFRVDGVAKTRSLEAKRSKERKKASSQNEVTKRSYADMKQKQILQNFINSASSGTCKFKGKAAPKASSFQRVQNSRDIKSESSCQVSTLSRKVLDSAHSFSGVMKRDPAKMSSEKVLHTTASRKKDVL